MAIALAIYHSICYHSLFASLSSPNDDFPHELPPNSTEQMHTSQLISMKNGDSIWCELILPLKNMNVERKNPLAF